MRRAVEGLTSQPDFILVDARRIPHCSTPQRGIIKGDTLSASIAAASIIAKTTRDAIMTELDFILPGYNFATHKGYPTPEHCRCLQELRAQTHAAIALRRAGAKCEFAHAGKRVRRSE